MADATYIEPVTWQVVEKIIAVERPDALLPTMGGQTALNCELDLAREGVLEKYGGELIGASRDAIDKIGRESCRGRERTYVLIPGCACLIKKKTTTCRNRH